MRYYNRVLRSLVFTATLFVFGSSLIDKAAFASTPAAKLETSKKRTFHLLVETKAQAAKVRKEIVAGSADKRAFRNAVRKYTKDVFTKPSGGDLGWVDRSSSIDEAIIDAALGLKPGEISSPVESAKGWHLVLVTREKNASEPKKSSEPEKDAEEAPEKVAGKAEKIIERYLRVIGGRSTLKAIRDRSTSFKNTKYAATGETVANISLFLKAGYKYREEWDIVGFKVEDKKLSFVQQFDGDEGWVLMFGKYSPLEGRTLSVFLWDKYLDDFFMHWKENSYKMEYAGEEKVDGKVLRIVDVADFGGEQVVRYFFSKENGLLVKKAWSQVRSGTADQMEWLYSDYTKIPFADDSERSILFPKRVRVKLNGAVDTMREYSKVDFNSGLDDKIFRRPKESETEK